MKKIGGQNSEIVLCLLPLIESGRAGLELDARAADVIAACARFNLWFLTQKSVRWNADVEESVLTLIDLYDEATLECKAAVARFHAGGERSDLIDALQNVAEKLKQRPDLARPRR